ncbi:MAG: AMP-binding protein, partial [Pseudonocardia sp.]|nr:AMP-binding protein [Pseudonocardia sp.]
MGSLDSWVRYWAGRGPARPALVVGDTVVTWGELADRAGRLAAGMAERGAGAGDRIDIVTRDPLVLVEMLAACAYRGAVAVPRDPG